MLGLTQQVSVPEVDPSSCSVHGPNGLSAAGKSSRAQAVFLALQDWDLEVVKQYAVDGGLYTSDEIDSVANEYRKFMALAMTSGNEGIPISEKLDDLWHTHILFTQDYASMCLTVAGRFIHHRPRVLDNEVALARAFKDDTLELYRGAFGEPDRSLWDVVVCKCCTPCTCD